MKRLFLAVLILFFACLPAYGDTEVVGGGEVSGDISVDSIQVGAGTVADPSILLGTDDTTGLYQKATKQLGISLDGALKYWFQTGAFLLSASNGAALMNETPSSTNPVFAFSTDSDTGIGRTGANLLSLISGEIEGARIYKNGVDLKVAVAFSGISSITTDYVMGNFTTDPTFFIECDATLGNISTTLPPVADKKGRLLGVKLMSAANGCYLDGNGAETIDGAAGQTITTQYNVISLIAGATEWLIR